MSATPSLGRPDRPLRTHQEDRLSIKPYAAGLASFVRSAETPMTIGIQGEWGSGKTSLMQLVLKNIKKDSRDTILTHWFETWQYGASGGGDSLGLLLMRDLCISLVDRVKDERWQEKLKADTFGFLKKVGRGLGAAAINTVSAGTADGVAMVDELTASDEAYRSDKRRYVNSAEVAGRD